MLSRSRIRYLGVGSCYNDLIPTKYTNDGCVLDWFAVKIRRDEKNYKVSLKDTNNNMVLKTTIPVEGKKSIEKVYKFVKKIYDRYDVI